MIHSFFLSKKNSNKGIIIVNVLIFGTIAVLVSGAMITWAAALFKNSRQLAYREEALQIAEAGIDYYRWHLAHAPTDYQDGTGVGGPYTHDFKDKDGNIVGQYILSITPPPPGSTIVRIRSEGRVTAGPGVSRKIEATLAIPSLAKFAVVANDVMRFGAGTEVFGPVHSNEGIRFDGLAHNLISSSKSQYVDPDNGPQQRFGVYTTINPTDPSPPAALPNRPDVFIAGRQFPLASFDFTGLTSDLSQIKTIAQANGRYFAASGAQGYRILLKTNDTFDLYRVNSIRSTPAGCSNSLNQAGWGTWSVNNQTFLQTYTFPADGVMFFEDHIWVEGAINTARITIAAGRFPDNPTTRRSITVNNDIIYTNYDGKDVLALISQDNFHVGLYSDTTLRIDAALIAQNGRAGRYYYSSSCGANYIRSTLTLYGMIGSNKRYGFAYTDGTGYGIRNIIYDANLLYGPPPSFPLTSNQYSILSWEEIK